MRAPLCVVSVALLCLLISCAGSGANLQASPDASKAVSQSAFGSSWNAHCTSCNFVDNYEVNQGTTLGDMHSGSDFGADIALMDALISWGLGEPSGLAGAGPECLYIWYDSEGDDFDFE
jgi:hypothetical protein